MGAITRAVLLALLFGGTAAAQPVSTFPPASLPLSGAETAYVIQNGVSKQTTVGNLITGSTPNLANATGNLSVNNLAGGSGASSTTYWRGDGTWATPPGGSGGSGTVTSTSVVSANGFAGSVATATTTPAITLSTTITGVLKGNATAISAATAGTDYLAPAGSGAALTGITWSQIGSTPTTLAGYGIANAVVTPAAGIAYAVGGTAGSVGFDTHAATLSGFAFRSAAQQKWDFSGTGAAYLFLNTGYLQYVTTGGGTVFSLDASGNLGLAGTLNATSFTGSGASLTGITYSQLPALSANQVLGALTATTPSGLTMPSCSAATSALTWTSGSGFGCNTTTTGTVTSASVVSANGFAGTVATATTTPAITLSTSITGVLKGNGTAISAATAGTDYLAPAGSGAALTGITWSQIGTTPTTLSGYGITNGLSTSLASTDIIVGNGSGVAAAVVVSGDATLASTGALTVTKTSGTAFAPSATTDTTNASNITSGTLGVGKGGTGTTSVPANGQVPIGNGTAYAPAMLNATHTYTAASGAWTVTLASDTAPNVFHVVTANSGETSAAITMPATSFDQQRICVNSSATATVASVVYSANSGQSLSGVSPTEINGQLSTAANGAYCWVYQNSSTTWLRVQ